jgi:MFS transporter, SHS family, lactate transporter
LIGLTYQLGNLASSASATIQAIIAERYPLPPAPWEEVRLDYGKVIGIFMGAVWAYDFFWLFFGPEMAQSERDEEARAVLHFEKLKKEGASLEKIGRDRAREGLKDGGTIVRERSGDDVEATSDYLDRQTTIDSKELDAEHIENRA